MDWALTFQICPTHLRRLIKSIAVFEIISNMLSLPRNAGNCKIIEQPVQLLKVERVQQHKIQVCKPFKSNQCLIA